MMLRKPIVTNSQVYNLGTGHGVSVLQLIETFQEICGNPIPYKIEARREGDIPEMYANTDLACKELAWKTKYNLKQMCKNFCFCGFLYYFHSYATNND